MPRKRRQKKWFVPHSEIFIHGEVESWHVLMVTHDRTIEVPREQAQYEEKRPKGEIVYTRRTVSDHLSLEMVAICAPSEESGQIRAER
jgi:hypothetical protein